jgi:ectoine hydroxylase
MPDVAQAVAVDPLGSELLDQYQRDGYLMLPPGFLGTDVLGTVDALLPRLYADDSPRRVMERDNTTIRSVYGLHQSYPEIAELTRSPELLGAVEQIVGHTAYVHQSKINFKAPFSGDQWEWHQDYIYWLQNDGIQRPDLVNVAVFLDEVTEFNGPLTFVPGSHRRGVLAGTEAAGMPTGYEDAPSWVATLTAEEKFQVGHDTVGAMVREGGLVSPKGPAGSVLFFSPNILHTSAPNSSPFRRAMVIFVYNSSDNGPHDVSSPRPPFLSEPTVRALTPMPYATGETPQ